MTRNVILVALLLAFAATFYAQGLDYQVIAVKGRVLRQSTQLRLETGSGFSKTDTLLFENAEVQMTVLGAQQQILLVQPHADLRSYSLKEIPSVPGARSGKNLDYLGLHRFFEGRRWLILGGETTLEVGRATFPLDNTHFFYVRYEWSGSPEPINKQLPQNGQEILFSKAELFKVDGKPIHPEDVRGLTLFYYDSESKESEQIGSFQLVFPDEEALLGEVGVIRRAFGNSDVERNACRKQIEKYLLWMYGEAEAGNLSAWIQKLW